MSAIYGIIDLNGRDIRKEAATDFLEGYSSCRIDRHEQKQIKNALMGCELQYYTNEAPNEVLPIIDEEHKIMFTADCIIDNREQLIKDLNISDTSIPDGSLIYRAYLKWGKDCASHLRGMFSFVVYNYEKQEVTLFADQFVNRCLFYHFRDNTLYFSTLLLPLAKASGLKYELNDRWLVDSISVITPAMMFETKECAYKDVYKVDCGEMVHISMNSVPKYERYYDPVNTYKTDYSMTEKQCKDKLHKILSTAVSQSIRTSGEVAVQLSAGLDSTTIACLAAPMLKENNRNLYSFTSIPLKDSTHKKDCYHMDDETEGVMTVAKAYPNIIPEFLDCPDKNILTLGKHIIDFWELPCQSEQNAVWIDDIFQNASNKGCKIMLSGATGNCTVSAGGFLDLYFDQIRRFHFIKAWKDFSYFCKEHHYPRKRILKSTIKDYFEYLKVTYTFYKPDNYQYVLTRKDLGERLGFTKRIVKKELYSKPWISYKQARSFIYLKNAYSQIGEIDTKHSLMHGVMPRDPMRNVEFINFLLTLPMEFFVNKNFERRLVREFMLGIVPNEICLDTKHRGRQSADNTYRVSKVWDNYKNEIIDSLLSEKGKLFFDSERVSSKFAPLNQGKLFENELDMRICIDSYLFLYYVDRLNQYS